MERSIHNNVSEIINNNNKLPSIINEKSNFVVITYWWGRGNLNRNTARPCTSFYEDYLKKINNYILKLLNTSVTKDRSENGEKSNPSEILSYVSLTYTGWTNTWQRKLMFWKSADLVGVWAFFVSWL